VARRIYPLIPSAGKNLKTFETQRIRRKPRALPKNSSFKGFRAKPKTFETQRKGGSGGKEGGTQNHFTTEVTKGTLRRTKEDRENVRRKATIFGIRKQPSVCLHHDQAQWYVEFLGKAEAEEKKEETQNH
jgi:hypothetical protein